MELRVLISLKESIKKWEAVRNGKGIDMADSNCSLCHLCRRSSHFATRGCANCPVCIKTGKSYCVDTPYNAWSSHHRDDHDQPAEGGYCIQLSMNMRGKIVPCPKCKKLAAEEVRFLKGLLPKKVMRKEVIEAIKGSIKKWRMIAAGKASDKGPVNCPLCQLFFADSCFGCPIYETYGTSLCEGTPYDEWSVHQLTCHSKGDRIEPGCDKCKKLVNDEIKFLKGLLPEEGINGRRNRVGKSKEKG